MEPERGHSAILLSKLSAFVQLVLGVFIVFIFGMAGFFYLVGGGLDLITLIIVILLVLLGVWLIRLSNKRRRLIRLFRQYAPMLSNDPLRSLDNIATLTGHPLEQIKADVEQMVHRRFFGSAYVNLDTNCLVLASQDPAPAPASGAQAAAQHTVHCPGCGAVNQIVPGGPMECEFCGTKLEGTNGGESK